MNFTKEQEEQIIELYKTKINIENIINDFNCEEHDIRTVLKENQVDRIYNNFSQELYNRIIELYTEKKYTQKKFAMNY